MLVGSRGESIDFTRETLYKKNSKIFDFFDYNSVTDLVNEHLNGECNRRLLIWSLLNVEHWLREIAN